MAEEHEIDHHRDGQEARQGDQIGQPGQKTARAHSVTGRLPDGGSLASLAGGT